jgi:hypothetical protein
MLATCLNDNLFGKVEFVSSWDTPLGFCTSLGVELDTGIKAILHGKQAVLVGRQTSLVRGAAQFT